MSEDRQQGRRGKSAHRRMIELACKRLINEELEEGWMGINLLRETKLDIKAQTEIRGEKFGNWNVATAEQTNYCDVACAVTYDPREGSMPSNIKEPLFPEIAEMANRALAEGDTVKYREMIRRAYGRAIYIIECETNPKSNLLRNGPRLTAYQLLKQQNRNVFLILAVFEGTKVDNPQVFDAVWEFPRKKDEVVDEQEEDGETGDEKK